MCCLFIGTSLRSVGCGGGYKPSIIMTSENFILPSGI